MSSGTPFTFRIKVVHLDKERVVDFTKDEVIVGRPKDGVPPDLDLYPDLNVSRRHCKFTFDGTAHWIEDTSSSGGTLLNDAEIKSQGRQQVPHGSTIRLGDTSLIVELPGETAAVAATPAAPAARKPFVPPPAPAPAGGILRAPPPAPAAPVKPAAASPPAMKFSAAPEPPRDDEGMQIATSLEVGSSILNRTAEGGAEMLRRLAPMMDLQNEFGAEAKFEDVLQRALQHALNAIPAARRGAFLLQNRATGALLLSAYIADGEPAVSETLARRAMTEKKGFIWSRGGFSGDVMASIASLSIQSGMYVPVLWHGQPQGVICVDNPARDNAFTEEDLRLLAGMANYVAMIIANRNLQEEMKFNAKLLDRLLLNFSPRIRAKLLEKAHAGKLRPGGEKSEVTILFSDMRGFTAMSANMDAGDVVDLVNDYLPALSAPIFKQDGTIDKFLGDAILAVFGSPDPDPQQHEKAIHAGLAMQQAVQELNAKRKARGDVTVEVGIGIHCGPVLHGFIGAQERLEFTVIGDAVNRANRYCSAARGGEVLISPDVYQRVYKLVQAEKTTISTKHEGDLAAYRIKGVKT